jgi:hypothetical protein
MTYSLICRPPAITSLLSPFFYGGRVEAEPNAWHVGVVANKLR